MALPAVDEVSLGYECCLTSEIEDEIPEQPKSRFQIILLRLKSDRSVLSGGTFQSVGINWYRLILI